MQTNLVADAVDEILDKCESLQAENIRLRIKVEELEALAIHQQRQIENWRGAALLAHYALKLLNKAAGPVLTQIEIISRPKKGAG